MTNVVLCFALLVLALPVKAGYTPLQSVVDNADLILVGTVANATLSAPEVTFTLLVDRVIKGPDVRGALPVRGQVPTRSEVECLHRLVS